jgi:hypothetical protein
MSAPPPPLPPLPRRQDFDTTVAHPARVWDYWLGGKDNFAADREAGERVIAAMPTMESVARAGRAFLAEARNVLDFGQPVAVMLLHVLHFIPDTDDPYGIVAELMEPLPSGSYLVVAHGTEELERRDLQEATSQYNRNTAALITPRTKGRGGPVLRRPGAG